jgi:hypothetical protein
MGVVELYSGVVPSAREAACSSALERSPEAGSQLSWELGG